MGRMNPMSYGPAEPQLWLVGKIPPKTCDNCRETSERKARTHSYDDLVDLLIQLAIVRENDSHMDKYLRKHLRRDTLAERNPRGRSPHPHSNPALRAHLDHVPLNYQSETVVQPSSTAHFHYGFPTVEPLLWYSNKLLSSNLKTAIFQPCKRCHTP